MRAENRRKHAVAEKLWGSVHQKGYSDEQVHTALLQDLRAVMYDVLDEQRETNRILRMAFGVEKKEDET